MLGLAILLPIARSDASQWVFIAAIIGVLLLWALLDSLFVPLQEEKNST